MATTTAKRKPPGHMARLEILIDSTRYTVRRLPDGSWTLRKQGSRAAYNVAPTPGPSCDCTDFNLRRRPAGDTCNYIKVLVDVGLIAAPAKPPGYWG